MKHSWVFPLLSCRVYDGDTLLDMKLDLGFNIHFITAGRLDGINAPEVRGADKINGLHARDWLKEQIDNASEVLIETRKGKGKYGRWIITVWADKINLNDALVKNGYAIEKSY